MRRILLATFSALVIAGASIAAKADQIITLRSGNGAVGGLDSAVSMLVGPANSAFAGAFTPADFAAAAGGPQASIVNRNAAWLDPSAFSDPSAQWITTSPTGASSEGATALYAIDFTITDAAIAAAQIVFNFAVDNFLGGGSNQGLFINGAALSGGTSGGNFGSVFTFTRTDIAPLLTTGLNTLYINSTDAGGPSGLLFSATITTTAAAIAEPGMAAILGVGLVGLGVARRRAS